MTTPLQRAAAELWQHGMTQISVDPKLVLLVRETHKAFMARRHELQDYKCWSLLRSGEFEPDRGLVCRWPKEGKDVKFFFHFDANTPVPSGYEHEFETGLFYRAQNELFRHVNGQVRQLLRFLEPHLVPSHPWSEEFALPKEVPYSWTTLRTLQYPPGPQQTGARPHIDRSFLSVHMGDEGGELRALDGCDDLSGGMNISPPTGKAVVFFGVKALWLTSGKHEPLWHSSVTNQGEERFALVQFCHLPLPYDYRVKNANEAHRHYWQEVRQLPLG